jgi:HD superfamily phosphohydrolase
MSSPWSHTFLDPLYGRINFDDALLALIRTPTIQRLRHVRLSNIDSLDMPAIANLSRFEHVLGVAYLSGQVGFRAGLPFRDSLVLRASALLHDWAITSFGHLVEEALQYVGTRFDHEEKLGQMLARQDSDEIGGADLQILVGRETGLRGWAKKFGGNDRDSLLHDVMLHIQGKGRMGRAISGEIDLDNIDNVFRMAFHMGLDVDRDTPRRLAKAMVALNGDRGEPVFRRSAEDDIERWRQTRAEVYENLMLAERDFTGKLMMLYATVRAYEVGEITSVDWALVDHEFLTLLLTSGTSDVVDTAKRWIAGDLWERTPLRWLSGERPDYPSILAFSHELAATLGRPCFAYAIKDKRNRRLSIAYDDGTLALYGETPKQWLLGVGSPRREPFGATDTKRIFDHAQEKFGAQLIASADRKDGKESQGCLF